MVELLEGEASALQRVLHLVAMRDYVHCAWKIEGSNGSRGAHGVRMNGMQICSRSSDLGLGFGSGFAIGFGFGLGLGLLPFQANLVEFRTHVIFAFPTECLEGTVSVVSSIVCALILMPSEMRPS